MCHTEVNQELKQLQTQLADILEKVILVCERNEIDYYMAWGSCLGAVRHNDFIPWDDDIDLYIPYSQLESFKKHCLAELPGDYFYQDMETDPNYFLAYPKVRKSTTTSMNEKDRDIDMNWGIGIDIFPLFDTNLPEKPEKIQKKVTFLRRLGYMPYYAAKKEGIYQKLMSVLYSIMGNKGKNKRCEKLLKGFDNNGDYYMDIEGDKAAFYPKKLFEPAIKMTFGSLTVRVMNGYDEYLTQVYGGDYMVVPKKGSAAYYSHDNIIIDCENSYKNYLTQKE